MLYVLGLVFITLVSSLSMSGRRSASASNASLQQHGPLRRAYATLVPGQHLPEKSAGYGSLDFSDLAGARSALASQQLGSSLLRTVPKRFRQVAERLPRIVLDRCAVRRQYPLQRFDL